jgi:Pentapeptide repeats (8 copies)
LLVALAGVTHKDLLLNNPVELPFVRITIELDRFFIFAPIVFLIVHFAFLLQHAILSRTTYELTSRLESAGGVQRAYRLEVNPYFYSQAIAGPWHENVMKPLLDIVIGTTFLILPIALLLFFQISFLPNHDARITSLHQMVVLLDVVTIMFVGGVMMRPRSTIGALPVWKRWARRMFFSAIAVLVPAFAFCVATLPDSWMDRQMRAFGAVPVPVWDDRPQHLKSPIVLDRTAFFLTAYLFEGAVNYLSGKSSSWFSRNLIVTDSTLRKTTTIDVADIVSIPGRDFRYATFDRSDFHRVNLNGSDLAGAKLVGTILNNAMLSCAQKGGSFQQQSGCANLPTPILAAPSCDMLICLTPFWKMRDFAAPI